MKAIDQAIQYVRENKTWTISEEIAALERIDDMRCDIDQASPKICEAIHDLMEEWSADNDMPEGWWYNECNEDDIFFEL